MNQNNRPKTQHHAPGVDDELSRHGGLTYLEIPATDPNQSADFYRIVLGWIITDSENGQPKFSDPTGHLIGRWITTRAISRKPGFLPFIYVDHIDAIVRLAASHGAEIVKPIYREGNLFISILRDPAGNMLGLWQAAPA